MWPWETPPPGGWTWSNYLSWAFWALVIGWATLCTVGDFLYRLYRWCRYQDGFQDIEQDRLNGNFGPWSR